MKRLGYTRYVAQGGDWGSPVSSAMARQAPAGLLGIHINLPAIVPPEVAAVLAAGGPAPAGLSEKERATFDELSASAKMGNRSYAVMMGTRPQTIGYAITDSPAGLAAWMLGHPGFAKWTYSSSDPEKSPDEVLDEISLYWLTNTATSSGRLYWESRCEPRPLRPPPHARHHLPRCPVSAKARFSAWVKLAGLWLPIRLDRPLSRLRAAALRPGQRRLGCSLGQRPEEPFEPRWFLDPGQNR